MTENEALKITKLFRDEWDRNSKTKNAEALDIAIQALSEIQQYRAIGTVEQLEWCKDASHWKELFKEKLEKYEAIGTVEELQKMKGVITDFPIDCGSPISNVEEILNQLKKYLAIGTIEEFKAYKQGNCTNDCKHYDSTIEYVRNKAIDEFAHQFKENLNQEFPSNYESTRPYFSLENARLIVDDVAEQMKAGGTE